MLYLLDSVAKNIRATYAPLFERNLPEVYVHALEAAPSPGVRTSLEHLRATWRDVFPAVRRAAAGAALCQVSPREEQSVCRAPAPRALRSARSCARRRRVFARRRLRFRPRRAHPHPHENE